MKKLSLFLLCIIISGCAVFRSSERELLKKQVSELQITVAKQNEQIQDLQKAIVDKDTTIKKLKDKLSTFGAFD